ncbi:MAG: MFS transporter [Pseudomonadota bacterium]
MDTRFYRQNAPWLAAAALMTFSSSFGQTFFISLSAGGVRDAFGLSDGDWGGIYTVATLSSALVLSQVGKLADRMALVPLILATAVVYVAAMGTVALAPTALVLGLGVFGLRLAGQGMMSHLGMTATARWFRANRGRAVAVAVLGFPLGEAMLPPLAVLVMAGLGWRATWGVAALVFAIAMLPAILALARGGRTPQGEGDASRAAGMDGRHWRQGEVLRHWSFWALLPGVLAPAFIGTVIFFHQVHVAETRDWALTTMALGYPMYAATSVALSLATGAVIDRLGPVRLLPIFLLPIAAAILMLTLEGGEGVWLVTLLGIGVSQGVVVTMLGALWPALYGTRHIGGVKALTVSATVIATAVGPGITGLMIDRGYALGDQAPAMAVWCLAASALFAAVAPRLAVRLAPPAPA